MQTIRQQAPLVKFTNPNVSGRPHLLTPLALLGAAVLLVSACSREKVLWQDCVILAANQKVVEDARHALSTLYQSNVLLIARKNGQVGHAYLVFRLGNEVMAYDQDGSRPVNADPERFQDFPAGIAVQLVRPEEIQAAKFAFPKK